MRACVCVCVCVCVLVCVCWLGKGGRKKKKSLHAWVSLEPLFQTPPLQGSRDGDPDGPPGEVWGGGGVPEVL